MAPFVLAGVGISMALPCIPAAGLNAVPAAALGKAAGVLNTMQQFGAVAGIAIVANFRARQPGQPGRGEPRVPLPALALPRDAVAGRWRWRPGWGLARADRAGALTAAPGSPVTVPAAAAAGCLRPAAPE